MPAIQCAANLPKAANAPNRGGPFAGPLAVSPPQYRPYCPRTSPGSGAPSCRGTAACAAPRQARHGQAAGLRPISRARWIDYAQVSGHPGRHEGMPQRHAVCGDAGGPYRRGGDDPVDHPARRVPAVVRCGRCHAGRGAGKDRGPFRGLCQMDAGPAGGGPRPDHPRGRSGGRDPEPGQGSPEIGVLVLGAGARRRGRGPWSPR